MPTGGKTGAHLPYASSWYDWGCFVGSENFFAAWELFGRSFFPTRPKKTVSARSPCQRAIGDFDTPRASFGLSGGTMARIGHGGEQIRIRGRYLVRALPKNHCARISSESKHLILFDA
jgi:hypothetical protein